MATKKINLVLVNVMEKLKVLHLGIIDSKKLRYSLLEEKWIKQKAIGFRVIDLILRSVFHRSLLTKVCQILFILVPLCLVVIIRNLSGSLKIRRNKVLYTGSLKGDKGAIIL